MCFLSIVKFDFDSLPTSKVISHLALVLTKWGIKLTADEKDTLMELDGCEELGTV